MAFDKPRIIKPSRALAEVFGESRPFIVSPPEHAQRLTEALREADHQADLAPESFDSDGQTLQCILLAQDTDYDAVRKCVRQFNAKL